MNIEAVLPSMAAGGQASGDPAGEAFDKASEITHILRDLVRCSAFTLCAWDPLTGNHRHQTVVSDGYTAAALSHMNDDVTCSQSFELTHKQTSRTLRWRDLEKDWNLPFAETPIAQEFLLPAGFHEGASTCLRLPDGRYTGSLHMSWSSAAAATDERRETIERFRPLLAVVCDLLRAPRILADAIAPSAFALLVSPDGAAHHLPGRPTGSHLAEGGALRRLLLEKLRTGTRIPQRFAWPDEGGGCHKVAITPCRENLYLVTEELVPWPYGLTLREIQVLHLIACGASNPQIAERLFVSARTISTHVEHILAKMDCTSRARLAAMAAAEGLLLAEDPRGSTPVRLPYASIRKDDFAGIADIVPG